jgi:hypothetical protein
MYPLLPAMRGVHRELIDRAIDELAELYREDEVTLSQQLVWMELLLERADTVPAQEKEEVQRRLSMYDPLWEEHPKVKKIRAEVKQAKLLARQEARAEAQQEVEQARQEAEQARQEAEQALQSVRDAAVAMVQVRFPALTEQAREQIATIGDSKLLQILIKQLATVPNEETARWLLNSSAA